MNRRTLEALIRGGAFDSIEPNRAMLLANIDLAMNNADQKAANANQGGLFDMMEDAIEPVQLIDAPCGANRKNSPKKKPSSAFICPAILSARMPKKSDKSPRPN